MDAAEYIEQRDDLVKYYQAYHDRVRKVLQYYNFEIVPKVPAGFQYHIPPSARSVPEALAAALHPTDFRVTVEPRTQKQGHKGAEDIATKMEGAQHDWLKRLDRTRSYSVLLELLKNAILFGMYVGKGPALNPDLWDDKPVQKGQSEERYTQLLQQWENQHKMTLPIDFFVLSPLNVLPDPVVFTGGTPEYVYESYTRLAKDVKQYGIATERRDFEEIQWVERWDEQSRIYIILDANDQSVEPTIITNPNPYGYIPYHFGFCGLGINSPRGKPEDKAVGVMWPILSNLSAEIRLMTSMDIVAQIYGLPAFRKKKDYEGSVDLTPGAENAPEKQLEELFERNPAMGRQILEALSLVYQHREENTYSRTLAAVRLEGVTTGIQQQLLTLQAYKRYEPLLHMLEDTWGKVGSQIAWIVENLLDEPLNEHIKPDEIGGYYACKVEFDVVEALERAAKIEECAAMAGLYSDKTRRQFYNFLPEAEDEEEQLEAELLAKHPLVLDSLAQKVAQRLVGAQALEGAAEAGRPKRQFTPAPGFGGFPQGGGGGLG